MRFVADAGGASITEAIAYTLIALAAAGGALWAVYSAVGDRFHAIADTL